MSVRKDKQQKKIKESWDFVRNRHKQQKQYSKKAALYKEKMLSWGFIEIKDGVVNLPTGVLGFWVDGSLLQRPEKSLNFKRLQRQHDEMDSEIRNLTKGYFHRLGNLALYISPIKGLRKLQIKLLKKEQDGKAGRNWWAEYNSKR